MRQTEFFSLRVGIITPKLPWGAFHRTVRWLRILPYSSKIAGTIPKSIQWILKAWYQIRQPKSSTSFPGFFLSFTKFSMVKPWKRVIRDLWLIPGAHFDRFGIIRAFLSEGTKKVKDKNPFTFFDYILWWVIFVFKVSRFETVDYWSSVTVCGSILVHLEKAFHLRSILFFHFRFGVYFHPSRQLFWSIAVQN